ncbi:MAG: Fic family protein [Prevotellaceae bacterium]|nr:Fic family protein [Prevotellaceae bacterium]
MDNITTLYKEWQSLQPLKENDQTRLDKKFMLEFNYNSNHIEGNTLTYGQTEMLLMFGKVVESANMKDLEEMKASNVGLKMVKDIASDKEQPLTEYFIRTLHRTLLREDYTVYRQLPDGNTTSYIVHAGQYKTRPNSVITATGERFEYASPEETPALMTDLLQWYNEAETQGELSPIELAALFHYRYIRIHPFEDGNGRVSRLIVNYILYRHGYPMIVVKSADKDNYLTALNRCDVAVGPVPSDGAHAELSQITPFVEYLSKCLVRALNISIKAAKGESIADADDWRKNLKLKYRDKINKPEVTEDIASKIINDFAILLKQIDNELSEFYSLFTSVKWEPTGSVYSSGLTNSRFFANIIFYNIFDVISSGFTVHISLDIQQFKYKIEMSITGEKDGKPLYDKNMSYNDIITEQDKTDIVNAIGRYINLFIETQGFTNKMF